MLRKNFGPRRPTGIIHYNRPHNKDNTLWVGNLAPSVSEFSVMKKLSVFGDIVHCNFMWNTTGPNVGQPRGFCFVEFRTREEAELAKGCANGMWLNGRSMVVHFAHERESDKSGEDEDGQKHNSSSSSNAATKGPRSSKPPPSSSEKIAKLQQKLELMQQEQAQSAETAKKLVDGGMIETSSLVKKRPLDAQQQHHQQQHQMHQQISESIQKKPRSASLATLASLINKK